MNGMHVADGGGSSPVLENEEEPVNRVDWEKADFDFFVQSGAAGYFIVEPRLRRRRKT